MVCILVCTRMKRQHCRSWKSERKHCVRPVLGAILARNWRRDRDSNPGTPQRVNGFRDRPVRPLRHLSASVVTLAGFTEGGAGLQPRFLGLAIGPLLPPVPVRSGRIGARQGPPDVRRWAGAGQDRQMAPARSLWGAGIRIRVVRDHEAVPGAGLATLQRRPRLSANPP